MNETRIMQADIPPVTPVRQPAWPKGGNGPGRRKSDKRPGQNKHHESEPADDKPDKSRRIDRYI